MERLIFLEGRKYDISGQAGNAYVVLGSIKSLLKQCSIPEELIEEWHTEATSDNYDHLLKTCTEATGIEFVNGKPDDEWLN